MRRLTLVPAVLIAAAAAAQSTTIGSWRAIATATTPSPRSNAQLVHDPVRGRTLLAGGVAPGQSEQMTEYWEFDGTNWSRVVPGGSIDLRRYPTRFSYSPLRGRIVALSSEQTYGATPMRLFEWTGTAFVSLPGAPPPIRADDFEIVWDSARQVLVMFGGGAFGSDTWEWDGTQWAQRGTGGPPGRRGHAMAFDAARNRVVLFGGESFQPFMKLADTWEWDGSVWRERFGIAPGLRGKDIAIAYDPLRARCVLYGGESSSGQLTNAVWEFDGLAWTQLPSSGGPAAIRKAAIAYEPAGQRVLSFGGESDNTTFGVTYEMTVRNAFTASYAFHGAGCAGPAGTPGLLPRASSRPVLGAAFRLRFANLPPSPLSMVFACIGFDDRNWAGTPLPFDASALGLTGCSLRLAPSVVDSLANQGGFADWDIPIPASPALDGAAFFVQGVVLAPGVNAGGALLSDSGRGVLGSF